MYVRPRCLELAATCIAERMSSLGPEERMRLTNELGLVIEQTIARWIVAECHNHELPVPDDHARSARRDATEIPRRLR
jgi:hypothetical protein